MFAEKFFEKYELKGHQNIHAMRVFPMVTVFYFGYYTKEFKKNNTKTYDCLKNKWKWILPQETEHNWKNARHIKSLNSCVSQFERFAGEKFLIPAWAGDRVLWKTRDSGVTRRVGKVR